MNDMHKSALCPSAFVASLMTAAVWLLQPVAAWAGPQLELTMSTALQVITRNDRGDEIVSYKPGNTVQPRDRMLYTISYRNAGDAAAKVASLVGAIPANSAFVEVVDAGSNMEVRFSADGGKKFSFLPFTFVTTDAQGKTVTREANADNFTHLRFTFTVPLEPGATGHVSYLVQIR